MFYITNKKLLCRAPWRATYFRCDGWGHHGNSTKISAKIVWDFVALNARNTNNMKIAWGAFYGKQQHALYLLFCSLDKLTCAHLTNQIDVRYRCDNFFFLLLKVYTLRWDVCYSLFDILCAIVIARFVHNVEPALWVNNSDDDGVNDARYEQK